jgi:hypothetical protein
MPSGRKKVFQTKLTDIASSDLEGVGTLRREGNNEYIWCAGVASTVRGSAVCYDEDYQAALLNTTLGAVPRLVAFAVAVAEASKWGWFQVRGDNVPMSLAASCAEDVALYTTGTAGVLDDESSSVHKVLGVVSDLTVTSAAIGNGLATYPLTI